MKRYYADTAHQSLTTPAATHTPIHGQSPSGGEGVGQKWLCMCYHTATLAYQSS